METKICRTCKIEKPIKEIGIQRKAKYRDVDYYLLDCKKCINIQQRNTRINNTNNAYIKQKLSAAK